MKLLHLDVISWPDEAMSSSPPFFLGTPQAIYIYGAFTLLAHWMIACPSGIVPCDVIICGVPHECDELGLFWRVCLCMDPLQIHMASTTGHLKRTLHLSQLLVLPLMQKANWSHLQIKRPAASQKALQTE